MTKDKPSRREPFIARRDEPSGLRSEGAVQKKRPRAVNPRSLVDSPPPAEARKFGFMVLCVMVVLLALCLAALATFAWRQSQSQQHLQQRFDDLTRRLAFSDESVAQSGVALAIKLGEQEETLATHWAEIKKLWGVANDRNKKAIKALQLTDGDVKKTLKKTQKSLASLGNDLGTVRTGLQAAQAGVKKVSSAALVANAQTDDFQRQLKSLASQLKGLDSEAASLQKLIEKNRQIQNRRLLEFEQAVKSMDAFRKQTNQKFSRLQAASPAPAAQ